MDYNPDQCIWINGYKKRSSDLVYFFQYLSMDLVDWSVITIYYLKSYYILNQLLTFNFTFKQSISYILNETLFSCFISGRLFYSSHFEWMLHYLYGDCFRYNKNTNDKDSKINIVGSGKAYGQNYSSAFRIIFLI